MHPDKKVLFVASSMLVLSSILSGCTIPGIFGSSFTIKSWSVYDDDGFPSLSMEFSCGGTVVVKTMDNVGNVVFSETFFYGTHNTKMNLEEYRTCINTGQYSVKAYDSNDKLVSEEFFSFNGVDLTIDSCVQKWWKREAWKGGYTLIGLLLTVTNNGDVPAYPYEIDTVMDSKTETGYVLPCVVLPGETKVIKSFVYREDSPSGAEFTVNVKDNSGEIVGTGVFDVNYENTVDETVFGFSYKGRSLKLKLPYPDFLYEYYSSIDRVVLEDYSLYVFDQYDDSFIYLLSRQLQYSSSSQTDADKINFVASFVQSLEYKEDEGGSDYPNYPIETLFNRVDGCDCEDMSILTASVLDKMGYDVALFRLANHMAVGVKVPGGVAGYGTYDSEYYYLETTSKNHVVGYIPSQYVSKPELVVYEIKSRPILHHSWYNNNITIFYNTEQGNVVKATSIITNLGSSTAENVIYEGVFVTQNGLEFKEWDTISSIEPGMKKTRSILIEIPSKFQTNFLTRLKIGSETVHDVESKSTFP